MRNLRVIAFFVGAMILLAPVVQSDGLRTFQSHEEQHCENPMPARKMPYTQHFFIIPSAPEDFDFETGIINTYCFGAAFNNGEPVPGVKWNVKGQTFVSEGGELEFDFPDTRIKIRRNKLIAWGIYDIFRSQQHNLNVSLLQNFFSGDDGRGFFFAGMQPRGGKKVDHLVTECGVTFLEPCRADSNTLCVDHDGVPGRFQIDFSGFDSSTFTLEPTSNGGNFTLGDGSMWSLEVDTRRTNSTELYPINKAAFEVFLQPEVLNIFDDNIIITDKLLGDTLPGTFRRDFELDLSAVQPLVDPKLQFVSPRDYRLAVGLRF